MTTTGTAAPPASESTGGRCAGATASGDPCQKKPASGSQYCAQHDPERSKRTARRASTFGNVRQRGSGRWQATYWYEGALRRAPETFATKADARAWLSREETAVRSGGFIDPAAGKVSVAQLAALWLASNARKRSSTLARDEAIVRLHLLPEIGARPLSGVKPADVQSLVNAWALEHAPSTVRRHYAVTAAMFAYAVDSDRIVRTPCRRIRLPQVRQVDRPELSADDLERLAGALGADQAVMMWTGAALGLRFAECAGLTVDHLDLLAGSVAVDRQLGRDGTLSEPKSAAGKRTLACPAWLVDDLAALLVRRGLTAADGAAFVFVSPTGTPLHYTNWRRRVWLRACQAAGLPELVFHDLRSLSATALIDVGTNVKATQRRLGHSSPQVTLGLYAKATSRADREAAEKVGAYLRPSRRATGAIEARTKK